MSKKTHYGKPAELILEVMAIDAEARRLERERIADITTSDIVQDDVELVEDLVGMGHGAWDTVDPREIIVACVKVVCAKLADKDR